MTKVEEIDVDSINPPNRTEKLHPYEDEDIGEGDQSLEDIEERLEDGEELTEWESFRASVKTSPKSKIQVVKNGDGYDIIDGDRRFRAASENDADTLVCEVFEEEEIDGMTERRIMMMESNESRRPSNKYQRSWHTAQLVAPWLLPPGERDQSEQEMTQREFSVHTGKSQGTVSNWLTPIKNDHKLRAEISGFCVSQVPSLEDVERMDNVYDLLTGRTEDFDHTVIHNNSKETLVANKLSEMEGFNLRELESAAESAAEGEWNSERFLQYLEKNYATTPSDDVPEGVETGMMDGTEDFELDNTEGSSSDMGADAQSGSESGNGASGPNWDSETPEPNWESLVDEGELSRPISDLERARMLNEPIEDGAAVGVNILAEKHDMTPREVMRNFVDPVVTNAVVAELRES